MKRLFLFFTILLISCNNNKKINREDKIIKDSISQYFRIVENDSLDDNERILFSEKIIKYYTNNPSKSQTSELEKISNFAYKFRLTENLKESSELLYNVAKQKKDTLSIGKSYNFKGKYYLDSQIYDSAFYYFVKAEKIFEKYNDSILTAKNYLNKSSCQLIATDNIGAITSSINAIKFLQNNNDPLNLYIAYNNIADASDELEDYENALAYYKKALNLLDQKKIEDNYFLNSSLKNNIGYVYLNQKKYNEAILFFKSGLEAKNLENENPSLFSMLMDNLAYSKFKIKDFSNLPDLFYKSLKIREREKLYSGIIINKRHLSEYYQHINDTLKSQKYANEALLTAKKIKSPTDILISYKQLFSVDKKKAILYSEDFISLNDSIQLAERKSKDKFARIAFETDEIIQQKDILEDKNRSLLYTFIGVLFLLSLLFVVRAQRARTKELMFKQAQQRANEEIYNLLMAQQDIIDQSREIEKRKIARDLHDGILSRMFGARLNLDSINHLEDSESVKKRLEHLNELKEIEQDIREISHDLSREKQDLINNFVSITTNLFEEQSLTHSAKLTYFMDSSIKWDLVKNNIKINVFRILQESLQNINKYAKANNIHVEFRKENGELYITVTDDGIGFDIAKKSKGIGMQNMISRAIDCNGKLDISSNKENGTKITLTIPLE